MLSVRSDFQLSESKSIASMALSLPRKSRCLGIHHPPGHVVKQGIGTFRNIQESVAHQVLHPYLKVGYASQYLLVPLLLPLGLSRFIHRGFAFGFLLLLFGLLRSFGKPRRHPFRLFRLRELVRLAGVQQQQAKPMLAREFAARAGTLERNVIQVYHRLVGILSASLAMTPDGTSAAFPQYPFAQGRKSLCRPLQMSRRERAAISVLLSSSMAYATS